MQPPPPRPRRKHRIAKWLQDIRTYHKSVKFLIPRASFVRLAKEIIHEFSLENRITADAMSAIQESMEIYLTQLFEGSFLCAVHRKRVTILPKDLHLARRLRREHN
ncbi:hypothetical protein O6H91_07G108800 [Diphasiastrum complanatum]|uniref:Uncharacterized protein n=1 Tax=Diphasiastrum complanatum TaxID=34168 RepID=A0ACC2D8K2_DIPCM|nr:hypothetical protein O6H91_07G108800 [Diphasiastrum complanatum]